MTELVEKVARGLCAEKCAFRGEPPCWKVMEGTDYTFPPETCCEPGCEAEARAVIAIVAEECARVAEDRYPSPLYPTVRGITACTASRDIATAIRALGGVKND